MPLFNQVGGGGYKLFGAQWVECQTTPYFTEGSSAVVLNNEIHIFSGLTNGLSDLRHFAFTEIYTKA